MPPQRSKKTEYRTNLFARIVLENKEMSPCSRCEKRELKCLVGLDSSRCSECVRSNTKCDVLGPSQADWAALERGEKKLREQLEAAEAEQQKLLAGMVEVQNRVLRLKKQRESFVDRAASMLRRGLKSLEELDEVEEEEKREKEEAERREQRAAPSSSDVSGDLFPDPFEGHSGVVFGADLPLSPSFWESLQYAEETPSGGPGS